MAVFIVIGVFASSFDFFVPAKAAAAGGQLPSPVSGNPLNGNSSPESLAIAQSKSITTLIHSPVTWVKLYFSQSDVGNPNIQVFNMPFDCSSYTNGNYNNVTVAPAANCNPGGVIDDPNHSVLYDLYNTDANETPTSPIYTIDGQTGKNSGTGAQIVQGPGPRLNNWSGNIPVPLGGTIVSVAHPGYYVVLMRVRWGNCPNAINNDCSAVLPPLGYTIRLNAFLVQTTAPQDLLGYWAQNGATGNGSLPTFGSFTTHYNGRGQNFDIKNIEVDFAPPCTVNSPQPAAIRWKNGDVPWVNGGDTPGHDGNSDTSFAGSSPWGPSGKDQANYFDLWGIAPNGTKTLVELMPGGSAGNLDAPGNPIPATGSNALGAGPINDIGGFQDYREVTFTAQPGYKYQWIWHDVNSFFGGNPPGNAHNLQMWVPYDSINSQLGCYTMNLTAAGTTPTVVVGSTGTINLTLRNTGPNPSDPGTLQIQWPGNQIAKPCAGGNCPDPNQANLTFGVTALGFRNAGSGVPGVGSPDWYWNTAPFPNGAFSTGSLTFTVPAGTAPGVVTFDVYFSPGGLSGLVVHKTVSFTIVTQRTPSLSGLNSDIHAGGGLCNASQLNGNVTTNNLGASYDEYVVSASGTINSLKSNNAVVPANDTLKLGNTGSYAQVCREDLLTAVNQDYPLATANIIPIGGGGTSTLTLSGNEEGVYYFNGAHLILNGTVGSASTTKALTIIARFGDVEINGNILLTASPHLPKEVPSLGIIASSDIKIDPAVTQVDAYMFSSAGTISTCNAIPANCSTPLLTINGFMMATDISFGRTGIVNSTGNAVTEKTVFNPQLYLNPPKYFDAGVDNLLLEGQGERPPLF